jgi:phosphoribosylglycinamide formyltransferase-1
MTTLGILISGRGSNMQAIVRATADGRVRARVGLVFSNRASAAGLEWARDAGLETAVLSHKVHASRESYDLAVVQQLRDRGVEVVCLAGFMRLLSPAFIAAYPNAILNVHPSLLPAFPGVDAQRQALEHGVRVTGATVHLVTADLDAGPIVSQAAVAVRDDDTVETLSARILEQEHRIYPEALAEVIAGGWDVRGRRFIPAASARRPRDAGEIGGRARGDFR